MSASTLDRTETNAANGTTAPSSPAATTTDAAAAPPPSLLQTRLLDIHGVPVFDTVVVTEDNDDGGENPRRHYFNKHNDLFFTEEKKEDTDGFRREHQGGEETNTTTTSAAAAAAAGTTAGVVVNIKTLVWEVEAIVDDDTEQESSLLLPGVRQPTTTTTFFVVTALPIRDKVDVRALKNLVLEATTTAEKRVPPLRSIRSMQLAPLEVAEGLTGYRSGCMPPICHNAGNDDDTGLLCIDRSIVDVYNYEQETIVGSNGNGSDSERVFASIGSGIPGKSLLLPMRQFLRAAGVVREGVVTESSSESIVRLHASGARAACAVGSFVVGSSLSTTGRSSTNASTNTATNGGNNVPLPSASAGHEDRHNGGGRGPVASNSNEFRMMSGYEKRELQREERKQQREMRKDRLKEYRGFDKDDVFSKAKLLRTTARKRGRTEEMKILINEAVACGDFTRLMEIPDEQSTNTNIDKNALHICAWRGDFETVVRLVETAAVHCPHLDVVNLISKGPGNYGKTPIFYALTQCRADVVRYLVVEAGADLLVVNNKGQTPCSIAKTHVSEEICLLLYETEAKQLKERAAAGEGRAVDEMFADHRAGAHSDHKLYGDLDPRFPVDDDNRYKEGDVVDPKYGDKHDLVSEILEYEESVRRAPEGSIICGYPTEFSPRSLRPTVRWWNRDDLSLAMAHDDQYSDENGRLTPAQSRPVSACKRRAAAEESREAQNQRAGTDGRSNNDDHQTGSQFVEVNIESMELLSIDEVLRSGNSNGEDASSGDAIESCIDDHKVLVDSPRSLRLFEEEVNRCVSDIDDPNLEGGTTENGNEERILLRNAWGLDCEWKPGPGCGEDSPVATLQLGTTRKAFLIDLQTLCRNDQDNSAEGDDRVEESDLDRVLSKLFRDQDTPMVGYGVVQDLGKLAASFPQLKCFSEFVSVIDLQSVSSVIYNSKHDRRNMSSLQKMTATLLQKRLDKEQQVSDWSLRPLSDAQISYAMLDVAVIPLLLEAIFENNAVIERYNGRFFSVHKNLLSTIRFIPMAPCEDGFAYEIAYGSIKSMLGKAFARQSWPIKMKVDPPAPPKLVKCQPVQSDDTSTPTISKKERAHLRKIGTAVPGQKRPKPIPLKSLSGNLDNLPIPGITLGYTKESCAFRVVGHEFFKTIPEGTYIGFNRRAGVAETSNAWILFCNFGGNKVFSEFLDNGRKLLFRVNSTSQAGRSSEAALYKELVPSYQTLSIEGNDETKEILLFARESTRTKYLYCGFCKCTDVSLLDESTAGIFLQLENYEELMDEKLRIATDFKELVAKSLKKAY